MWRQDCTNFPDIAQQKSRANIEQKDEIVRNPDSKLCVGGFTKGAAHGYFRRAL